MRRVKQKRADSTAGETRCRNDQRTTAQDLVRRGLQPRPVARGCLAGGRAACSGSPGSTWPPSRSSPGQSSRPMKPPTTFPGWTGPSSSCTANGIHVCLATSTGAVPAWMATQLSRRPADDDRGGAGGSSAAVTTSAPTAPPSGVCAAARAEARRALRGAPARSSPGTSTTSTAAPATASDASRRFARG